MGSHNGVKRRTYLAGIGSAATVSQTGCLGLSGDSVDTLRFLGFGGNTQESQMSIFEKWSEESGIDVEGTAAGGTTEMISLIQQNPGEFDVIALNDTGMARGHEEGIIQPIDLSQVPNYEANVREGARHLVFNEDDGDVLGLIREHGATGYAYNTELVDEELTSWDDLKRSEFEGEVALLDRAVDRFSNCAAAIGENINDAPDDDNLFDRVVDEAVEQNQNVFSYWSDGATSIQYLRQENAAVCEAWGGRVLALQEDGYEHIEYVVPDEGAMAWCDNLAVVDGSESYDTAHELLDFTYQTENLLQLADDMNYTVPVPDPPEWMREFPDYAPTENLAFRAWSKILPTQDAWSEEFQSVKQS